MRRLLVQLVFSFVSLAGLPATAAQLDSAKETDIEFGYDIETRQSDPCCRDEHLHFDHTLKLLPGNIVKETSTMHGPNFVKVWPPYEGVLGKSSNLPDQIWHVMPNNTLLWGGDYPQSIRTKKIKLLPDNRCVFEVKDILKRGYTQYAFPNAFTGTIIQFSKFENSSFTCSIH